MHDEQFQRGQKVRINANGLEGAISAIFTDAGGTQYRVDYADASGCIQDRYFRADEITAL